LKTRFILPVVLGLTLMAGFIHPARAAIFGPDMPGWNQSLAGDESPRDARDDENEAASDPLTPIRAALTEAQDLAQSGRSPDALSKVEGALRQLDELPPSRPGVASLRERLEEVRDKAARQNEEDREKNEAEEKEKDKEHPDPLDPIQTERNERVEKWLNYYTGRGRERFQIWLQRSGTYMDLLTRNLRAEGIPEELANLVFVESGFNMHAKSVASAVGPWQFIRGTARIFGLEMTAYKDERRDPELATRAAARYLRRLYTMFDGSWPLALAAYNSGEGTVMRAIKRQKTRDFWKLRLPRETQDYVPKFLAAMEIASDPERYGFQVPENSPLQYDRVMVTGLVDLTEVARVGGLEMEELKRLNPVFVRHRMPGGKDGTEVRVPHGKGEELQLALETSYKPKPLSKSELRTAAKAHRAEMRKPSRRSRSVHVVRRGEALSQIAAKYGTSTTRLAKLNNLSSKSHIRAGQKLRIR
jgi:membrane-bound lytic murein transglycosylase D